MGERYKKTSRTGSDGGDSAKQSSPAVTIKGGCHRRTGLVLSRKLHETIMIGDDVEVTVVDIQDDRVRLGISLPEQVRVHRKEVYEEIERKK